MNVRSAVVAAREEKIAALTAAAGAVSAENGWSDRSVAAAKALLADAGRRFSRANSLSDVDRVYDSLLASLDAAKRLTPDRAELDAAIRDCSAKLESLMRSVDPDRCGAVLGQIEALCSEGLEAIRSADTPERAAYRYADFQNRIRTLIRAAGGPT